MSVHPQAQAMLDMLAGVDMDPDSVSVEEMRAMRDMPPSGNPAINSVTDKTLSLNSVEVPVRIYSPGGEGPHSLIMFFHGGGWVFCGLDTHDSTCRAMANEATAVVVSVDYRLSPEAKYPAALEDCYAATEWAVENAVELNANPDQLVVAGDSAGGNLATVVSLMARDNRAAGKSAPEVRFQVPIYPVTNHNFNTTSYTDNSEGYYLTQKMMRWFWDQYLPNDSAGQESYASPLLADLEGLPPALVITAEYDPLRDEGEAYADRLSSAGVNTELVRFEGQIHGFIGMADLIDDGREAVELIGKRLRAFFAE
ncbi:MAG: alpha/beta hydrolase [Pseudomonadales bacterium]